jgi:hypothetical protein
MKSEATYSRGTGPIAQRAVVKSNGLLAFFQPFEFGFAGANRRLACVNLRFTLVSHCGTFRRPALG